MWGLRIGDELKLTWSDILDKEEIVIIEQKTGKRRVIRVNKDLKKHIEDCYKALGSPASNEPIFLSRLGTIYSREWVNMRLKEYKVKYRLSIKSYSSHSHRKTFGRHIVERAGADAEKALIKLSEIFSHSSCEITRRYLGLKAEEIGEIYESLDF
jgi:integrase